VKQITRKSCHAAGERKSVTFKKTRPTQGCQMAYFQTKNPTLGKFLKGLAMEDVGLFYGNLVYFATTWYNLWQSGILYSHWVHFFTVLVYCLKKNLATLDHRRMEKEPSASLREEASTTFF
jgi:hypothetical protein